MMSGSPHPEPSMSSRGVPDRYAQARYGCERSYSGVSAGTELTAYRGTNPYLTSTWDPGSAALPRRIRTRPPTRWMGWGYSEVGEVVEMRRPADVSGGGRGVGGDIVWGIWGHRSEGVVPAATLAGTG